MLLMIDNYDSFTYNLVQYFGELGEDVRTYRNDEITLDDIARLNPDAICLSPGPSNPQHAGITLDVLREFAGKKPILGVCLGHQAIGEAFGGRVVRAKTIMHGKVSRIETDCRGVFADLPKHFDVTRYHSLAIERESLPDCLEVSAWTDDGEIMGVRHKTLPVEGVQFHPESILSEHGHALLENFLKQTRGAPARPRPPPDRSLTMTITPQEALQRTIEHREIFHDEMLHLMRLIMRGDLSPVMAAAIITGLRVKKETIGEIAAAATVMREFANHVEVQDNSNFVDIVGTGGDGSHTFNISTASMFVTAAAGAKVAKHGNRGVSSKSGSADVLEALGVNIDLQSDQVAASIAETGMGFMFAPNHHPAMKNIAAVRRELGVRTIFNILGPLTNPAGAPNQLMGVFHADLVGIQVRVMQRLGAQHVLVVYGKDGMDEVSLGAATLVGELRDGKVHEYEIHPEDFGLQMVSNRTLKVENADESRTMLLGALDNQPGVAREIVTLNAGTALYAANVAESIADGIQLAREAIASGKARAKVDELVRFTQQFKR